MIRLRQMTGTDLALGLRLSRAAGWNQTEADWRSFLTLQPDGCFVAEWAGTPVGTTTTTLFGSVAWIAMVLVEGSVRGRGIGTALLTHALDFLDRRVATIRLDATPLGRPLYERLGFVAQFELARYEGLLPPAPEVPGVAASAPEQWEELTALDEAVTGTARSRLLLRLFADRPGEVRVAFRADHRPGGFLASRRGDRALQLGPCISVPEVAPRLFADAWHRHAGQRVFLDVPLPNRAATALAEARGLTVQRSFTRMCRGRPLCERLDWLWASSGPETG